MVTAAQATVEVFLKAFQGLSRQEQTAFLDHLFHHRRYREDLLDLAILEARRHESSRPLRDYLADHGRRAR